MSLEVLNITGKATSAKVSLKKDIFDVKPNDHAIYLAVKQHLANKRQGTHKAKEVSELSGSTRKIKKQKGTGTARAGSIKSPLFRGGARVFGPKPRNYGFKLNKKVKELARKSALSYKAKDKDLMVIEDFSMDKISTKKFSEILSNLKTDNNRVLMLTQDYDKNIYLSARNIPFANVKRAADASTYDIMKATKVIVTKSAMATLENTLNKKDEK